MYFAVFNFEQKIKINLIYKQTAFFVLHQKKTKKKIPQQKF